MAARDDRNGPEEGVDMKIDEHRQQFSSARDSDEAAKRVPTGSPETQRGSSGLDAMRARAIARWENEGGRVLPTAEREPQQGVGKAGMQRNL